VEGINDETTEIPGSSVPFGVEFFDQRSPTKAETRRLRWMSRRMVGGLPRIGQKEWTIGVSDTDVSISYLAARQKAVQNKAKEMGVKIVEVDAKNDTYVELSNVENLLQQKVDLLLFEGASLKASGASIEAANKAKIPVVHFNILPEGGEYVTFVGSNHVDSGITMGKQIDKLYKVLGKPTLNGIYMRGIAGYITDKIRKSGCQRHSQGGRNRGQNQMDRTICRFLSRQGTVGGGIDSEQVG
jgi:ABC-type sugar transport system substrate-binding protein